MSARRDHSNGITPEVPKDFVWLKCIPIFCLVCDANIVRNNKNVCDRKSDKIVDKKGLKYKKQVNKNVENNVKQNDLNPKSSNKSKKDQGILVSKIQVNNNGKYQNSERSKGVNIVCDNSNNVRQLLIIVILYGCIVIFMY